MRRGWPLLVILCALSLAACAGSANLSERSVPAAFQLDYLDKQKVELQSCLGPFDATQIERRENSICITIGRDAFFESNSERIRPATCMEIDTVAE